MLIGYARVSTVDQNLDLQTDALEAAGCGKIFTDKISGTISERPGLERAFEMLREGDTLVVWKLDRLGRSIQHLISTVNELQGRGVGFRSLQENIDTTGATGKLIFHLFAAFAQFERDLISERTKAGLRAAKRRGRTGGRKPTLDAEGVKAAKELLKKHSIPEVASMLRVSQSTVRRRVMNGKG